MKNYPSKLVFLHGLFGSQQDFLWYKHNLYGAAGAFSYDLPNHGSRQGEEPFSVSYLLADLEQQLRTAGIERALFVGHSLGGQLALRYAALHPERVEGVCLLDIFPLWTPELQEFQAELLVLLHSLPVPAPETSVASCWQTDNGRYMQKFLARRSNAFTPTVCESLIRFVNYEMPLLNEPPCYTRPLWLLRGEQSAFTAGLQEDALKRIYPQLRVVPIAGAGHLLHLTHRYAVCPQIQDFIVAGSK